MTYNVFGETLKFAQSTPIRASARSPVALGKAPLHFAAGVVAWTDIHTDTHGQTTLKQYLLRQFGWHAGSYDRYYRH